MNFSTSARATLGALGASLILAGGGMGSSAHAAGDRLTEIVERGVLRVGVLDGFAPWSFRQPSGGMQGIEVDLGQSVADALGVKLEPVVITTSNRMQFLQQGRIDLIIGGMYDTAERRKQVGMIEPAYWTSGPTLMAKKGAITRWEDIADKPVCGTQGTFYNKEAETKLHAKVIAFVTDAEATQALRSGKCVAWIYDDTTIMADLASGEWDDYEMPVPVLYNNPWATAVPLEDLNKAWGVFMTGMAYRWHTSGHLIELEKKWNVKQSDWFVQQQEKLKWDTSYLGENK